MKQTWEVSTNIFLQPAKFFFMAIICVKDDFYLIFSSKKDEYQKKIFLDFTNKFPIKLVFTNKT